MFTGIVSDVGRVIRIENRDDLFVSIQTLFNTDTIELGASVCCSGVCLSVVEKTDHSLGFDVSPETLSCTTLSDWKQDTSVNLERSLCIGDELGGHFVSGHIDAVTTIESIEPVDGSHQLWVSIPNDLRPLVVAKGSVTIDGVSLTVNTVNASHFMINVIPVTWKHTTMQYYQEGTKVNIEADMFARYIYHMIENRD